MWGAMKNRKRKPHPPTGGCARAVHKCPTASDAADHCSGAYPGKPEMRNLKLVCVCIWFQCMQPHAQGVIFFLDAKSFFFRCAKI